MANVHRVLFERLSIQYAIAKLALDMKRKTFDRILGHKLHRNAIRKAEDILMNLDSDIEEDEEMSQLKEIVGNSVNEHKKAC